MFVQNFIKLSAEWSWWQKKNEQTSPQCWKQYCHHYRGQ